MAFPGYYNADDPAAMYHMLQQRGGMRPPKRFDEYYRCYPTVMLPGPERHHLNYGGKIMMPPSALEKLTRLHITYPMLFELINGQADRLTHAGVLEFVAEEGKVYLPHWMMQTLLIETGDLLQVRSTDLEPARLVKLQPQSTAFLDISDPKAVLEKAFRGFATLTQGDIFTFDYNDTTYDVAVLEVKPVSDKMGVSMLETDVEVDFAAPIGYVEPSSRKDSGTSTPRNSAGLPAGGMLHSQGTMAQAINYDAIAPSAVAAAAGARAASSHFLNNGHSLKNIGRKPKAGTATSSEGGSEDGVKSTALSAKSTRKLNGPQPLRLAENKLFFGFEHKPLKTQADKDKEDAERKQPHFLGQGQMLKDGKKVQGPAVKIEKPGEPTADTKGQRLDGKKV